MVIIICDHFITHSLIFTQIKILIIAALSQVPLTRLFFMLVLFKCWSITTHEMRLKAPKRAAKWALSWDYFVKLLLSRWRTSFMGVTCFGPKLFSWIKRLIVVASRPASQIRREASVRKAFDLVSTKWLPVVFGRLEAWRLSVCLLAYCKYINTRAGGGGGWRSSEVVTNINQKKKPQTTHCESYGHIIHVINNSQSTFLLYQYA